MSSRPNLILLLLAAIAAIGLAIILIATPYGVGTSPDSVAYIGTAQNLRTGQGLTVPLGGFENQPLTQFPPLYPLLLGTLSLAGSEAYATARLLSALLLAANIFLVGWILYRLTPQAGWAAVFGSLGMLLAPVMLEIHLMAWSESLFILLGFSALSVLAAYLKKPSSGLFTLAAVLSGLTLLTRYAGVVFLAVGLLGILALLKYRPGRRMLLASLYVLVSSAPLALYLVYNQLVAGSATNRIVSFHPVTRDQLWQGLTTLSGWLGLPASLPTGVHLFFIAISTLLIAATLYLVAVKASSNPEQPPAKFGLPPLVFLLAAFTLIYGVFLLFSISFIDANTPLDNRILSPIYVSVWILLLYSLARWVEANRPRLRWSLIVLLTLLLLNWTRLNLPTLATARSQGIGFSTPAWQSSELIGYLGSLPDHILIFSNAPDAVYLLTRRPAARLPRRFELSTQQENVDFAVEMHALEDQMDTGKAVIAYFTSQGRQNNPSQEDLQTFLSTEIIHQFTDGLVFSAQQAQP